MRHVTRRHTPYHLVEDPPIGGKFCYCDNVIGWRKPLHCICLPV